MANRLPPLAMILAGLVLAAGGVFGGVLVTQGVQRWLAARSVPEVSFQKVTTFFIEVDKGVYQLGAVVELFNLDQKPLLVNGVTVSDMTLIPRGSYLIQQIFGQDQHDAKIEDNYLKANGLGRFRILLPLKIYANRFQGSPPDVVFLGPWRLTLGNKSLSLKPDFYGPYDQVIDEAQWRDILKSNSTVDFNTVGYKPTPAAPPALPTEYSLLFNPDRTARFDEFGFGKTPPVTGDRGVMLFVVGPGIPALTNGWTVLGHSYREVWADPQKLALYNSLYPPDTEGKPRPFGVFAGADAQMMGAEGE